ncbi:MAG TPA: sigma-70 factor domain-containing protein, partial [Kofleriaceae bacterium]|nr:sigma-70 factor domain-containing protein [Kofleriaceae bacterium]
MAGKSRTKKSKVIDVGDRPAEDAETDEGDDSEAKDDKDEGLDTDLANAGAIDVGEDSHDEPDHDHDDVPRVPVKREAGSLARRDPLGTYMAETRRYPLLTPEEEH